MTSQSAGFTRYRRWDFRATGADEYPLLLRFPYYLLYSSQVVKQADLVFALYTCGDRFTPEQKRYLEGFVTGIQAVARKPQAAAAATTEPATGPDAAHQAAQDRVVATGLKLVDQEKWKRDQHPFDAYAKLKGQAAAGAYPKPDDNFRWRFYGLFYVAPNQDSYMCRLRIPNGILTHWQFSGIADLSERYGGGYAHVTTRANLQIREIEAANALNVVEAVQDLGLTSRGSGADNIRNVTGTPTAGIDPHELLDTRPFAREWHFHVLNDRSLIHRVRRRGDFDCRFMCRLAPDLTEGVGRGQPSVVNLAKGQADREKQPKHVMLPDAVI